MGRGDPLRYKVTRSRRVFSSYYFLSGHTHSIPSPGSAPGPEGEVLHFHFFKLKTDAAPCFSCLQFSSEKKKKRTPSQGLVLYLWNLIKPRNQNLAFSFIDSHTGKTEKLPNKLTVFPRHLISNHVPASCINPSCRVFLCNYTSGTVRSKATLKSLSQTSRATKGLIK